MRREDIIRRSDRLELRKETDPTKTWCPYCGARTSDGCIHLTDHGTYRKVNDG